MRAFPRISAILLAALNVVACSSMAARNTIVPAAYSNRVHNASLTSANVTDAYLFLDQMMDKYATGSTRRLVRSFDGGALGSYNAAVTYDDAVLVDALLARGTADDVSRAQTIGNAFLYVQANDAAADGRLRGSYAPRPLWKPADVIVYNNATDVGNMAWVGQALVQLYKHTANSKYLTGALSIANWIETNTFDSRGAGGYTGGYTASGSKIRWKSTEHNIDTFAFFTMLATESGQSIWSTRAAHARKFVASMWDSANGRFYVGSDADGITPNTAYYPEDVNSWSYLAFENRSWSGALDWDVANTSAGAGGFNGVSFCSGVRSAVWFEGTAHLAEALLVRNGAGDGAQAQTYLSDIAYAQANGTNGNGMGIIAASKKLSDCDSDYYYASLHVGATAWYVLAAGGANPFRLIPHL